MGGGWGEGEEARGREAHQKVLDEEPSLAKCGSQAGGPRLSRATLREPPRVRVEEVLDVRWQLAVCHIFPGCPLSLGCTAHPAGQAVGRLSGGRVSRGRGGTPKHVCHARAEPDSPVTACVLDRLRRRSSPARSDRRPRPLRARSESRTIVCESRTKRSESRTKRSESRTKRSESRTNAARVAQKTK